MRDKLSSVIKRPYFLPIFLFSFGIIVFGAVAFTQSKYPNLFKDVATENKENELILGSEEGDKLNAVGEPEKEEPTPTVVVTKIPTITKKPSPTVTLIPTNTPSPSPTPTPEATNTPNPTQTPVLSPPVTITQTPTDTPPTPTI